MLLNLLRRNAIFNPRFYSTTRSTPLSIAIVGSGPGGFYTAYRLLKLFKEDPQQIKIDIFEKYPTPYGLVRFGVAPDHPEVKICQNKFEEVMQLPNVNFYGNIEFDQKLNLNHLKNHYNKIVLSTGANNDKTFNIPGEASSTVFSARSFVGWYNGDPEYSNLNPKFDTTDTAVILGQGNVALDIARVLLAPLEHFKYTDITQSAMEKLSKSKIKHVKIVGRRGPLQVAFTSKELREMFQLGGVKTILDEELFRSQLQDNKQKLDKNRALKRLMTLMEKGITENKLKYPTLNSVDKICEFQFLLSPLEFINDRNNHLEAIKFGKNKLVGDKPSAVLTDEVINQNTGLAFRSIGYKSSPIKGVPFDNERSIVPNYQGRVIQENIEFKNLYVSGWLKTGPIGVIATTMMQAFETAEVMYQDYKLNNIIENKSGLDLNNLRNMDLNPTTYKDWKKLDDYEVEKGSKLNKPREKVTAIDEMLDIIKN